jgi:uncharacterized OB-fold protein
MSVVTEKLEDKDVYLYHGQIYIPNTYTAGTVGSNVLIALRDKKKILGVNCPTCNRVSVPARSTCKDCFGQLTELVEVSDKGTVLTYTVCNEPNIVQPEEAPIIYGIIQLDGADNGFVHMIGGVDAEELSIGMRVQAVFKEERTASILDIKYFKPL